MKNEIHSQKKWGAQFLLTELDFQMTLLKK